MPAGFSYQALAIFSTARAVPPTPQTFSTRCSGSHASFRADATAVRIFFSSFFFGHSPSTQVLNSARDPMGRLWAYTYIYSRTSRISVLPPPMSKTAPSRRLVARRVPVIPQLCLQLAGDHIHLHTGGLPDLGHRLLRIADIPQGCRGEHVRRPHVKLPQQTLKIPDACTGPLDALRGEPPPRT